MMRRVASVGFLCALSITGCQLYLPDRISENNASEKSPGSLSILAAEAGGFAQFILTMNAVEFVPTSGGATEFGFVETDLSLFTGVDATLVGTSIELSAGNYSSIRLDALDGRRFFDGSYIDDPATPLEIPSSFIEFTTDYVVRATGTNDFTLVIHTASALLLSRENEQDFYRFRPAGYMVRSDQTGYVQGIINACPDREQGALAVYVFRPDAQPRDIRGPVGNQNESVVSFSAQPDGRFLSPPLPTGDWQFSYTCRALDDDPETAQQDITDELRDHAVGHQVDVGQPSQATTLNFR